MSDLSFARTRIIPASADEVIELRFSFQIEADRFGQVHPIARQFTRRRGKRLCAAQQRQRLLVERGRAG